MKKFLITCVAIALLSGATFAVAETENKANERVVDLLSEKFSLPAAKIKISHGRKSRSKTVAILGPGRDWLARLEKLAIR